MSHRLIAALLAACAFASLAPAAEFEALQTNPVRDACMFSHYVAPDGHRHWLDTACTPSSGDAIAPGEGTPQALSDYAAEEAQGWPFVENGQPRLGLDGALSFHDTHGRAVFRSLNFGRVIRVTGPIQPGDTDRLAGFLRDRGLIHCYQPGYCPFQNVLSLDSPGGALSEALEMAQFVRDTQFNTLLEPGAECASACSFVFLAGYSNYEGFYHSRRFVHETARLGVHRPSLALEDRAYSPAEVKSFFEIFDYVKSEAVRQFVAARFPMRSLGHMYATPPEDMFHVPVPQMTRFATVFHTPVKRSERLPRVGLVSLCAEEYAKDRGHVHTDVLDNLFSNDDTFLTYVENDSFVCYGARTQADEWVYDICLDGGDACLLAQCMEDFESECALADQMAVMNFMEDATNGSLGYAFRYADFDRKAMIRLALLGAAGRDAAHRVRRMGAWVLNAAPPPEYCGRIDFRARGNAAILQRLLNAAGYDAGPVDGKPGNRTFTAVRDANRALLGVAAGAAGEWQVSRALLMALGADEALLRSMEYCA